MNAFIKSQPGFCTRPFLLQQKYLNCYYTGPRVNPKHLAVVLYMSMEQAGNSGHSWWLVLMSSPGDPQDPFDTLMSMDL